MTTIAIVEIQLVDEPDYETFVGAYAYVTDAIQFAIEKVQEAMKEFGDDGDPIVVTVSDSQTRIADPSSMVVYFVTNTELK